MFTIYLCANLHVTKTRSDRDELINNKMIDRFNRKLETLTDNKGIYYIDVKRTTCIPTMPSICAENSCTTCNFCSNFAKSY